MGNACKVVVATAVLLLAGAAQAALITWTLDGVRFDDGGTATGYFAIDPNDLMSDSPNSDLKIADFDITTTPGSVFPASHYTPESVAFPPLASLRTPFTPFSISFCNCAPDINFLLFIYVDADILRSRGAFPLITDIPAPSVEFHSEPPTFRYITEGSIIGSGPAIVPEPAAFVLLSVGVLCVVLSCKSRRNRFRLPPSRATRGYRESCSSRSTRLLVFDASPRVGVLGSIRTISGSKSRVTASMSLRLIAE